MPVKLFDAASRQAAAWAEIRRLFHEERVSLSEIGQRWDVNCKTVRRSLLQATWRPYHRVLVVETLLTVHADFACDRAPQVNYSARILYQELRGSRNYVSYTCSYETVRHGVALLREPQLQAARAIAASVRKRSRSTLCS